MPPQPAPSGSRSASRRRIRSALAFVRDETTRRDIEIALRRRNVPLTTELGGIESALADVNEATDTDIVAVDIRDAHEPGDDVAALQLVLPRACQIVALGPNNDEALRKEILAAGAGAYLSLPLQDDAVDQVFGPQETGSARPAASADLSPPPLARGRGRIVAVVGTRGGVGTTTAAVSIAWLLAHELGRDTALLDLDPFYGSMALALNIDPGDGLRQALERPSRIDSVFLDRAVRKIGDRLFLLGSEQPLEQHVAVDRSAPVRLVESLAERYERVVVDLPRADPEWQSQVLSRAAEIILITDLSLAGARDSLRLLAFARSCSAYARIRIIGGGSRHPSAAMLTSSEFRSAVGAPMETVVPFDARATSDAGRQGRALPRVASRSHATKAYRALVTGMEMSEAEPVRSRWTFFRK